LTRMRIPFPCMICWMDTKERIEDLCNDKGSNDLIGLCNAFKHNTRIICHSKDDSDYLRLEQLLFSSYYQQRRSFNNYLAPKFPPRVVVLGPAHVGKTKLALALKHKMDLYYLHAPHIIAQHVNIHSKMGIKAEQMIKADGDGIVDNDLIAEMMADDMAKDRHILENGYVLDAFPKNIAQAQAMIKYGVKPNRIIILTANDSVIEKNANANRKYLCDHVETPGFDTNADTISVHDLLDGYKKNIDKIKMALCDKKVCGCHCKEFDIEKLSEQKILELAYDFIIQPLPK